MIFLYWKKWIAYESRELKNNVIICSGVNINCFKFHTERLILLRLEKRFLKKRNSVDIILLVSLLLLGEFLQFTVTVCFEFIYRHLFHAIIICWFKIAIRENTSSLCGRLIIVTHLKCKDKIRNFRVLENSRLDEFETSLEGSQNQMEKVFYDIE